MSECVSEWRTGGGGVGRAAYVGLERHHSARAGLLHDGVFLDLAMIGGHGGVMK